MVDPPYAHSPVTPGGPWHGLRDHSECVAELAAGFARHFGSAAYARAAGLWHDLGKNAPDFQQRKLVENTKVLIDHKHAGAIYAVQAFGRGVGLPLGFVIAGHHGGLHDFTDLQTRLTEPEYLARLAAIQADGAAYRPTAERPTPPAFLSGAGTAEQKRRYEFWVRMLYSCLVDADGLNTEEFRNAGQAADRTAGLGRHATPAELLARLNTHLSNFGDASGTVNEARRQVLADCRQKAELSPRVFTLTAPTGAGKTLAGMAFALEHSVRHGLERVIVVIPYTSIIDQNAAVYRQVFGADNVLEHHASLDLTAPTDRHRWAKLAAENWDAPVVVTTSVQFLESLFANKPSRCRKLHNVCNSVVIFDEVQTLPVGHLLPVVDALKELVANYKVSLVLSTATQPAVGVRTTFDGKTFPGFEATTEIVGAVGPTFESLRRVDVTFDAAAIADWEALAADVRAEGEDMLVINHLRKDARTLAELVPGCLHLSALMCPKHRLTVIERIKQLLEANRRRRSRGEQPVPVRVVATQLVEAGVDLDFPVVFRAFGGLDSIAQAAGRCNREGRLAGRGEVRVFVAPTKPPRGTPQKAAAVADSLLAGDPKLDPLDPAVYDRYFRDVYAVHATDPTGVQAMRQQWQFRTLGESFSMIEDDGSEAVVVPYGDAASRLRGLERDGPNRDRLRALQPFVVTLHPQQVRALEEAGVLRRVADAVLAIGPMHTHLYDNDRLGLILGGSFAINPNNLHD